ncbi:unnamed protein product [Cuscuta epithymum]|uniref:Smr domain-containing protein n=1 Tax=Cuscuta epithymum TaxID=186058 RepID=A0AAV0FXF0_9ASTE|nr:unnamed protein product [Cuscuta epithymum]
MALSYQSSPVAPPSPQFRYSLLSSRIPHQLHHRRLSIFYHRARLTVRAMARPKELIFGKPSVTVEEGKYGYHVETLIDKLSSLPPRGSIARCLDTFRNKLSPTDFSNVFKEFASRGDWQRSLRLFKYMQRQMWCKPNEHVYSIMIGILGREGLLDKALEIFDQMPTHNVARNVFSYTAIINAFGRNGQYETSLRLLEKMKMEKVVPNILTYNTVINSCARGGYEWEGLLSLFAEMRHEGVLPDLVTYNTLLSACAIRGLYDEAAMVFRTMTEGGILPDITTYRYLADTFGKLGKLGKFSELLREMESGGNLPEVTAYNVLLEAYSQSDSLNEAMDVFRQMQAAGCAPNADTYTLLLNLYGKNGRYDQARDLFLEMKISNTEPDADTYNILIQVFGEGGYFKEVVTLFHDMIEEKVEPNMETYEGLAHACGKGGLHEDANKILLNMYKKDLVPSSKVYSGVIEAYGQAALYEEVIVAFNTMNEVGSMPDIETFTSMIHAFAKGGLYKEVEAVLVTMDEVRVQRNSNSFNGMIEGYRQGGRFEEAIKTYTDMEKERCNPDEDTFEVVLSVYYFAGLIDECEQHFREIKSVGIQPSVICYCMMLAAYAKSERWDEAFVLLDDMLKHKVSNMHQVIGQMIKGDFDDDTNWQMVEYVFDKLKYEGCGLGLRFYNALLEALWWFSQMERAARVLKEATKRGLFPELYRKNKLVWSVDVHRMWPGGACTAISVWLNNIQALLLKGEDLPHAASVVVVRGQMESSSSTEDFPIAKAANSFLKDHVSSFCFPSWNKGRIVCPKSQLNQIFSSSESSSSKGHIQISLRNTPLPLLATQPSSTRRSKHNIASGSELLATTT